MKRLSIYVSILFFCSQNIFAQIDEIKNKSRQNSSSSNSDHQSSAGSAGSNSSGSNFMFNLFFNVIGSGLGQWQRNVLLKRDINANIVSFESMFQVAAQPSQYYVFNSRIRGNWGIVTTDFRVNYMLQEDINGTKELRTDDWQIVALNIVNTKNAIARIGTGFMHEGFSGGSSYSESTMALIVTSNSQKLNGMVEYRVAKDFTTLAIPRREISVMLQKKIFDTGAAHGFITIGTQFQRYYNSINVWGIQAGFILKLYRDVE